jgi:hypothetical protein
MLAKFTSVVVIENSLHPFLAQKRQKHKKIEKKPTSK